MLKTKFTTVSILFSVYVSAQNIGLAPITTRVNVQMDTARQSDIIDGEWVAIGIKRPYAVQKDTTLLFNGKPSYRFELKDDDNSLEGYEEGSTKGRTEFSYCYATTDDYKNLPIGTYATDQILKMVYDRGKGQCQQGSKWTYKFSVYIPATLSAEANTIFAQWHGMPSRTLVQNPTGKIMQLTPEQFVKLSGTMQFKNDEGYENGKKNGWKIEQGGFPPLAFGFSDGMFYIKTNSDSKWMTDKTDRTLANPKKNAIMEMVSSAYKISTIAYKSDFDQFPKDTWVTFIVNIDWSEYGGQNEKVLTPGKLDVTMRYQKGKKNINEHIVNNQTIAIGRNDECGYYFKFGIYRTGSNTVPVTYNLAGFRQLQR